MDKNTKMLGEKGCDKLTGFTGTIVGVADYVWGCQYVALVGEKLDKDGKPMDVLWFDRDRIEVIVKKTKKTKAKPQKERASSPGGPGHTPFRSGVEAEPGNESYK